MKWACLILLCTLVGFARAGERGDSVVVVYNSLLPESKSVAEHYAAVRHVPSAQVTGFDLPASETMTRTEYRNQLMRPLLNFLRERQLLKFQPGAGPDDGADARWRVTEASVRYIALCYGVPLRILEDPNIVEPQSEKVIENFRRNGAAVDSELCLLPCSDSHLLLTGPLVNPGYNTTNIGLLNPTNCLLMVTRLDGPTPAIARALVDKSMEAETNGLWGRAYFDLRGLTNGDYKKGDDWLRGAAEAARHFGFETVIDDKPETFSAAFPMSQIALYAGWYDGAVSGPFTRPNVEFMPGAFAYHLHSFSAQTLRSASRNWCGPLLAAGATATMGCVDEPYLEATPNMAIFFSRWLLLGFTFGEAAYASQPALSWQTTFVGDPLYRPFGKDPRLQHEQLLSRHSKLIEWSHLRVVDLNLATGASQSEIIGYLEAEPATRSSAVLTEKLADLYKEQGRLEPAIDAYKKALKLKPTPLQSVRIKLAIEDARQQRTLKRASKP